MGKPEIDEEAYRAVAREVVAASGQTIEVPVWAEVKRAADGSAFVECQVLVPRAEAEACGKDRS
jgi:hypothetical protein